MTRSAPAIIAGAAVVAFARLVTGVRGNWVGCTPSPKPRVYFANHASHGDFVLIWTVLPAALRRSTRPVAGADYWDTSPIRRFLAHQVFNAVLIDRNPRSSARDALAQMAAALQAGSSLILFPEGTRNMGVEKLQAFKSGLYHLACTCADVDLVPVWIENLNRVMPKGEYMPVPLLCTVTFGAPLRVEAGEGRPAFLERARGALLALADREDRR